VPQEEDEQADEKYCDKVSCFPNAVS